MYNSGALTAIFSLLFVYHAVRSTVQNRSSIWPRLLRRPHVKCQSFLRSWKPLPCHARFLSSRCDKKRKRPICFCEFLCPPARAKINYTNQDVCVGIVQALAVFYKRRLSEIDLLVEQYTD